MRDTNVLRGLALIALTLVLDVQRFMSSVPKIDRQPFALATVGELLCALAALAMFASATDNHRQTDTEMLSRQRDRLLNTPKQNHIGLDRTENDAGEA